MGTVSDYIAIRTNRLHIFHSDFYQTQIVRVRMEAIWLEAFSKDILCHLISFDYYSIFDGL